MAILIILVLLAALLLLFVGAVMAMGSLANGAAQYLLQPARERKPPA